MQGKYIVTQEGYFFQKLKTMDIILKERLARVVSKAGDKK